MRGFMLFTATLIFFFYYLSHLGVPGTWTFEYLLPFYILDVYGYPFCQIAPCCRERIKEFNSLALKFLKISKFQ